MLPWLFVPKECHFFFSVVFWHGAQATDLRVPWERRTSRTRRRRRWTRSFVDHLSSLTIHPSVVSPYAFAFLSVSDDVVL